MSEPRPPHLPYATPTTPRRREFGSLFAWALFIALGFVIFVLLQERSSGRRPYGDLPLSEFQDLLAAGEIMSVTVEGDRVLSETRTIRTSSTGVPHRTFRTTLPPEASRQWAFVQWLLENRRGAVVRIENNQNLLLNILVPLIPWVVVFAFVWFVVLRQLRKAGGTAMWPVAPVPVQPAPAPAPAADPANEAR